MWQVQFKPRPVDEASVVQPVLCRAFFRLSLRLSHEISKNLIGKCVEIKLDPTSCAAECFQF